MTEQPGTTTACKVWIAIAIAGLVYFLGTALNNWENPWKTKVLFDCPPIGDGGYVYLDPHEYHPSCEYFGPPINQR